MERKLREQAAAMKFRAFSVFVFAAGIASGGAAVVADEDTAARGHAILEKKCARCHAIGPTGASSHPQAPPFRDVVGRYPVEDLEEALAEGIMSGHPDMPEFVFDAGEIDAIIGYLNSLKAQEKGK